MQPRGAHHRVISYASAPVPREKNGTTRVKIRARIRGGAYHYAGAGRTSAKDSSATALAPGASIRRSAIFLFFK